MPSLNSKLEFTAWAFDPMAFGLFHRCMHFFLVEQTTDTGIRCPAVVIGVHTEVKQSNIDGISYVESYDGLSKRMRCTDP